MPSGGGWLTILLEETLGVGPLAPLMADPAVSDILVNRPDQIYVERFGRLEKTTCGSAIATIWFASFSESPPGSGRRIDESSPMVDARLPDGSRVNATLAASDDRFADFIDSPIRPTPAPPGDLIATRHRFRSEFHDFLDAAVRGAKEHSHLRRNWFR